MAKHFAEPVLFRCLSIVFSKLDRHPSADPAFLVDQWRNRNGLARIAFVQSLVGADCGIDANSNAHPESDRSDATTTAAFVVAVALEANREWNRGASSDYCA